MIFLKLRATPGRCYGARRDDPRTIEHLVYAKMTQEGVSRGRQYFACARSGIIAGFKQEHGELRKTKAQGERSGAACRPAADYRYVKAFCHQSILTAQNEPTTPAGEMPPLLEGCGMVRVTEPTMEGFCRTSLLEGHTGTSQPM